MNTPPPDSTIGPYEILRELGRGGMGVVYKAHDPGLNRLVALKLLTEDLARNQDFVARFEREARAAAGLQHPNVVTIYQIGHDGPRRYIAMEFIKGRDLGHVIDEDGPMDPRVAADVVRQAALALAAAHDIGIVHRDIKPQNIMLDDLGRVKVMDFGIAKVDDGPSGKLTQTGAIMGTPAYMSPEQCRGEKIDGRSDVFSLGAVLFEAITGKTAFGAETMVAVIQKVLFEDLPEIRELAPNIPKPLARIVEKATAKDPARRYQSAAQFAAALEAWLADPASSAGATGTVTQFLRRAIPIPASSDAPTRPGPAILAGGVLVALCAATAFFVLMGRNGEPSGGIAAAGGASVAPALAPEIAWTRVPEEGATIQDSVVEVGWRVANEALAERFQIGLNDEPLRDTLVTTNSIELTSEGPQRLVVAAVAPGGRRGPAIERAFLFDPNAAPQTTATLVRSLIPLGRPASVRIAVGDPDGDPVAAEIRLAGGEWQVVPPGVQDIVGLPAGIHDVEARAVDDRGRASAVWSGRVEVAPADELRARAIGLFTGSGGVVDEALAREILVALEEADDPRGMMWIAYMRAFGRCGFERDVEAAKKIAARAIERVRPLAAEPDGREAAFLLGAATDQGLGTTSDPKAGFELVRRAAEAGYSPAHSYLGFLYAQGRGVRADPSQARECFERGSDAGDQFAMNNLGRLLSEEKDEAAHVRAAELYRLGADAGSAIHMNNLGVAYHTGKGVPKDLAEARRWYERAVELGEATAPKNLERLLRELERSDAAE